MYQVIKQIPYEGDYITTHSTLDEACERIHTDGGMIDYNDFEINKVEYVDIYEEMAKWKKKNNII